MSTPATESLANIERVRSAFSAQAPFFDSYEEANPILQWMRCQVYKHEDEFLAPGDSIFELNAGTGIDAVYFARKGHTVFAIDNADGMLIELEKKVKKLHLEDRIRIARRSFTELSTFAEQRFDHIFSNFGGLNCIADLRSVTKELPRFLKPGGTITLVIMPRVCPWELLHLVKGNTRLAFRRFSRNGTAASIEGIQFQTYYFSPFEVVSSFDERFALVKLHGLASLSPPPQMAAFALKHPRLYKTLTRLDERWSGIPPFNRWVDHCIITMKYLP
jgi:ubiquinone/menaquinone biosynthesis C-methylase UbiE